MEGMGLHWPIRREIIFSSETRSQESQKKFLCREQSSGKTARMNQWQTLNRSFEDLHRLLRSISTPRDSSPRRLVLTTKATSFWSCFNFLEDS